MTKNNAVFATMTDNLPNAVSSCIIQTRMNMAPIIRDALQNRRMLPIEARTDITCVKGTAIIKFLFKHLHGSTTALGRVREQFVSVCRFSREYWLGRKYVWDFAGQVLALEVLVAANAVVRTAGGAVGAAAGVRLEIKIVRANSYCQEADELTLEDMRGARYCCGRIGKWGTLYTLCLPKRHGTTGVARLEKSVKRQKRQSDNSRLLGH